MARVVFENLTKIFRGPMGEEIRAVRDMNLTVENGDLVVLVGPSGSGKTTILRLLAGLDDVTSGCIKMDDAVVNDVSPKDRDIAMVFQHYALYPHMSVYENLAFGLRVRNCPGPEMDKRVQDAAELLGLSDCLRRKP